MVRNNFIFIPLVALLFSIVVPATYAQQTGLRFAGTGVPLDNRTGLNLTPEEPITFDSDIKLSFDLKFIPDMQSYFGYVFRAIIDNQNIDLVYSSGSTESDNFQLIIGSTISEISFPYPIDEMTVDWVPVELELKKSSNQITLKLGDKDYKAQYAWKKDKSSMHLFFGAHRFSRFNSTDLPNMDIRNIILSEKGRIKYSWPLDQQKGTMVREVVRQFNGITDNPHWILNIYSTWEGIAQFSLPGKILYAYDSKNQRILLVQEDSLYSYDLINRILNSNPLKDGFTPDSRFNLLYDQSNNQFIVYSIGLNIKNDLSEGAIIEKKIMQSSIQTTYWQIGRAHV